MWAEYDDRRFLMVALKLSMCLPSNVVIGSTMGPLGHMGLWL
jgi:hypothetical protein